MILFTVYLRNSVLPKRYHHKVYRKVESNLQLFIILNVKNSDADPGGCVFPYGH